MDQKYDGTLYGGGRHRLVRRSTWATIRDIFTPKLDYVAKGVVKIDN